jgi:hypothetical protein
MFLSFLSVTFSYPEVAAYVKQTARNKNKNKQIKFCENIFLYYCFHGFFFFFFFCLVQLLPHSCSLYKTLSESPEYLHLPRHPIHRLLNHTLTYQSIYDTSPMIELDTLPFGIHPIIKFSCVSTFHQQTNIDPAITNIPIHYNIQINNAFTIAFG